MPNLLSIPFKNTYPIDIQESTRNFIYAHGGGHPDEFKGDINLWQTLRKDGVGGVAHVDRTNSALLSVGIPSLDCNKAAEITVCKVPCTTNMYLDKAPNECGVQQNFHLLQSNPPQIQLDIPFATVFQPSGVPITLKNLAFERCGVLFNLAALYSQLAASEDRSTVDGIKRATTNYQVRSTPQ